MMRFAVIPTGSRPDEYDTVVTWCVAHGVFPITIVTSDAAEEYAAIDDGLAIRSHELNIQSWWNLGLDRAAELAGERKYTVAILNDDVVLPDDWYDVLEKHIVAGASGASGGRPSDHSKISGFAFLLNGKDKIRADENFVWWYGDDDIQRQCDEKGGFVTVPELQVPNLYAFSTNTQFAEQIQRDSDYYLKKYPMDVTVVVATCGSADWEKLGNKAAESVPVGIAVIRAHMPLGTVSEARNFALEGVTTEYVCFLDADDTLEPGYFNFNPIADVTATAIRYREWDDARIPKVWTHERGQRKFHPMGCRARCLLDGNWVHVGAIIRTATIKAIGGFKEYPVYEDWALFLELMNDATFAVRPQSVYRANVRSTPGHRNQSLPVDERNRVHEQIYADIVGRKYER